MLLTLLTSLLVHVNSDDLTLNDLCRHLHLKTLNPLNPKGLFISKVTSRESMIMIDHFGFSEKRDVEKWRETPFDTSFPVCFSIANETQVWIDSLPKWPAPFSALNET